MTILCFIRTETTGLHETNKEVSKKNLFEFARLLRLEYLIIDYNKELEDKEVLFDALENCKICIKLMNLMIDDMKINKAQMQKFASSDFACATDIADWLVKNLNIPFRESHHITGRIVKKAELLNLQLHEMQLKDFQMIEPKITEDIFNYLDPLKSINSRNSYGGTSSKNVSEQILLAKKYLNIK
jgi:argininosuccinate lyase